MDFFFAQLLIPVTALYIIVFVPRYAFVERWAILFIAFGIFVTEVFLNEPFALQLIIAGGSILAVAIYWICYARFEYLTTGKARLPAYDWDAFATGIAFTALACSLFATQEGWFQGYPWIHTIWHVSAALGQYYILCIRDAGDRFAALDEKVMRRYEAFEAALSG